MRRAAMEGMLDTPEAGEARAAWAIAPDDTIAWVDAGFHDLAGYHGVPELGERAVGRPLIEFVAGERPRELQLDLLARARRSDEPLLLRYRCDSPGERRFGVLELAGQPGGGVVMRSSFTERETRPPELLLDPAAPRDGASVRECAWCNRFDVDGWRDAEEAARRVASGPLPPVEWSICEICEMLLRTRA
jgi:hypothetical protein